MEKITLDVERTLDCDVCVIGGGVGGTAAAIASARNGANTVLVESSGCLGGQATLGLVTPLDSRSDRDGKPFGGILTEIVDNVISYTQKYCSCGDKGPVWFAASPHILKYVLLDKADEAGVNIRFHTSLLAADTDSGKITSVTVSDKSGLMKINAKAFIDASGDADLTCLSGAEYVKGSEPGVFEALVKTGLNKTHESENKIEGYSKSGLMQPVSIFFLMGNVDVDKAYAFNNKDLKFGDLGITKEKFEKWKYAGTCGFEITGDAIPMPQGRILVSRSTRSDVAVMNMSRVINIDGSDADSLNKGEILAQRQVIALVDFLKTFVPGFENAYYMQSGFTLGVRETRRIKGRYVFSGLDAVNCTEFDDTVAKGSYIIDIHDPNGKSRAIGGEIKGSSYNIPFRALVSKTYSNLLACGRCISADHVAHAATRIQGTCIMTGQAAGTAAALSLKQNVPAGDTDIKELRERLIKDGVML